MRSLFETIATSLLVAIALIVLGLHLHDRRVIWTDREAAVIEGWKEHNRSGIWLGREDAPIVITEFMDFTCPHCRALAPVTDSLYRSFPHEIAVVFQHFPLRNRPMALELAIAASVRWNKNVFGTCIK
jgi:thiol-disulfide isomerase/thioredoxin